MSEQPDTRLIHHTKETYDGPYDSDLMEQYKLYVESAEKRQHAARCLEPLSSYPQLGHRRSLRGSVHRFQPELLDVADSRYGNYRFAALVSDHQITRESEPRQV